MNTGQASRRPGGICAGLYIFLILTAMLSALAGSQTRQSRDDFRAYFDTFHVAGSFVLYDLQHNSFTFFNEPQCRQRFTPASTFKICNSLIGLETGVIADERFVIPWDSVERPRHEWNHDHDLKSAFKNSTVWYYQELARRVGGERMKLWLDRARYGNADTSGGIDRFWLTGNLRVAPVEQIDFLVRLRKNELPFSRRTMDIVRGIMVADSTSRYVLRAKTGLGTEENTDIGWYVGYVEREGNAYFFSTCIQNSGREIPGFMRARIDITRRILTELGIID
jgi:beta-lactamase class D